GLALIRLPNPGHFRNERFDNSVNFLLDEREEPSDWSSVSIPSGDNWFTTDPTRRVHVGDRSHVGLGIGEYRSRAACAAAMQLLRRKPRRGQGNRKLRWTFVNVRGSTDGDCQMCCSREGPFMPT